MECNHSPPQGPASRVRGSVPAPRILLSAVECECPLGDACHDRSVAVHPDDDLRGPEVLHRQPWLRSDIAEFLVTTLEGTLATGDHDRRIEEPQRRCSVVHGTATGPERIETSDAVSGRRHGLRTANQRSRDDQ